MKKIGTLCIVLCLILGGLGAAAYQQSGSDNYKSITKILHIDKTNLIFKEKEQNYIQLSFSDSDDFLLSPGKPILPKIIQIFELPFGVKEIEVQVSPTTMITTSIEKQIQPSPAPLPLSPTVNYKTPLKKDTSLYQSMELYPLDWFHFDVGVGVNDHFDHVTFVTVHFFPIMYIPAANTITIAEEAEITITYLPPDTKHFPNTAAYDLVLISPSLFSSALQPLIDHKNNYGVKTFLKTTEEIYDEYTGRDQAEQIKYFIKDAIEQYNIKYVLLVGGLKSKIYAKPKDNGNIGASGWHIPARYSHLRDDDDPDDSYDPGYPTDLYYADVYKIGGKFEDWDSDGDGLFAEWPDDQRPPEDITDLRPDVAVGRLASSDVQEVRDVVNKIITYETTSYGSDWFKKIIVISGDGFLDQFDLNIQWDTTGVPDGEYTINAQSFTPENEPGPIDTLTITVDKTLPSNITFNHDDHLNPALADGYPAPPIAEIVSVSEGNILGNTNIEYMPSDDYEAYCNELFWWANVSYVDEVLTIRGKSYDPRPYGNMTNIHVWVENNQGDVVFSDWRNNTPMYYEGEWVTGEYSVLGRGGALYYMPDDFSSEIVWTSNGKFTGPESIIESFSEGYGFAFFSGHGSPGGWEDQYPGIPGNRQYGSVEGLTVSNLLLRPPYIGEPPLFPMDELANTNKLPITVVGGCHNSLFNVSLIPSLLHFYQWWYLGKDTFMWTYSQYVPQCWSWYLVQLPETGAIATIGNTGLGWGWEGEFCTIGAGDGWVSSEFFRQYGDHYGEEEFEILGQVYQQTQTSYVNHHKDFLLPESWWFPDRGWDITDQQAIEQWVLLGDPSLKIGGYQ
jgi:hypothetical protein